MGESPNLFVGIDVGGTSVKEGLFTQAGELLGKVSVPTPPLVDEIGYAAVTGGIRKLLTEAGAPIEALRGIGLAVPCPIPGDGEIKMQANITLNLGGLAETISNVFPNAAVKFENDANAAALGEAWQGTAAGKKSMVMITIGTGVGGGVVVDGQIVSGRHGAGGEIGHMVVNPDEDRECGCGGYGHLEQYASATGVVSNYRIECARRGVEPLELTGPSDSRTVFQACREGDEVALAAMDTMAEYLGRAMAVISAVVDPESFVLGGGASASADVYLERLGEYYRKYAMPVCRDTPIEIATLGNDAGIIGAAYVGLQAVLSSLKA